jgi:hypothetical protein
VYATADLIWQPRLMAPICGPGTPRARLQIISFSCFTSVLCSVLVRFGARLFGQFAETQQKRALRGVFYRVDRKICTFVTCGFVRYLSSRLDRRSSLCQMPIPPSSSSIGDPLGLVFKCCTDSCSAHLIESGQPEKPRFYLVAHDSDFLSSELR